MSAAQQSITHGSSRIAMRRNVGRAFLVIAIAATLSGILALAVLLITIAADGVTRVSWDFLNSFPSRFPERAGIKAPLYGTLWVMAFTALFAIPIGIGAAIYLEEFAPRNRLTKGYRDQHQQPRRRPVDHLRPARPRALCARAADGPRRPCRRPDDGPARAADHHRGRARGAALRAAVDTGGLTRPRRDAVADRALPGPAAGPPFDDDGHHTRALQGDRETAPLIPIGALTFVAFTPEGPLDQFTVLPIQIFNWSSRPQPGFQETAAAGIIVLLAVLLSMNAVAILLRNHFERRRRW